jgi:hypothetical protein
MGRAMNFLKNRKRVVSILSAVAMMAAAMTMGARQEKTAEKPAAAAPAKPGAAEMERLKFYVGEWDYTETYAKGAKNTGVYTSKLGPGGNSLINTFHSQGPVGDFEGMIVMTWDAKEKMYKEYVFSNDLPGALVETGAFEGNDLVFRIEIPMGGAAMKLRNVTRITAPGRLESEQFMTMPDKPESLFVHVEAKKR